MEAGTRDFASPEEGDASPLAEALFGLGDVTGVFFGKDFVSVTDAPGVEWRGLKPDVLALLLDHFSANMPLFKPGSAAAISVAGDDASRSEEHTSELQSLMRSSYAVFCLKKKKK